MISTNQMRNRYTAMLCFSKAEPKKDGIIIISMVMPPGYSLILFLNDNIIPQIQLIDNLVHTVVNLAAAYYRDCGKAGAG